MVEQLTDYVRNALAESPIFDHKLDCIYCWSNHTRNVYKAAHKHSGEGVGDAEAQKILTKEMQEHCDEVRSALSDQPHHKFKLPPFH